MRKRNLLLLLINGLIFGALSVGCSHAQLPPTHHSVVLSGTAPSGCSGCTYVFSRATITGSTCPATTGTAYSPLNQSSPASSVAYTDTTAAGTTVCFIAQTVQGSSVSVPSNVAGPFTVPPDPTAPSLNGTTSESRSPLPQIQPTPTMASAAPLSLSGRLGR